MAEQERGHADVPDERRSYTELSVLGDGYELRRPLPVTLVHRGCEVIAEWAEASQSGIGYSEQEALQDLRDAVIGAWQGLLGAGVHARQEAERTRRVIGTYVREEE